MNKKVFSSNLTCLDSMLGWICTTMEEKGFSEKDIHDMRLSLEEALVNIIVHGYKEASGPIEIEWVLIDNGAIEVKIYDQAPVFNPLKYDIRIDKKQPLNTREEGGLGILFMKKFVDEISYLREKDNNILIMRKKKNT